ncbi:MAG TPA: hypothetical protein VGJ05_13005, partial [Fimbriiglobus sp.]
TIFEQLEAMRNVPENWDGYGGLSPRTDAIEEASIYYRKLTSAYPDLPLPYVTPTPDAGVLFSWDNGPHSLELHFDAKPAGIAVEFVYQNIETDDSAAGKLPGATRRAEIPFPLQQMFSGITAGAA